MSELEAISHSLRAIGAGVDRAQQTAAMADQRAEDIMGQAMVVGMTGTALGMQQIRHGIQEMRQHLLSMGRGVFEAMGLVAAAPPKPSPQETVHVLGAADERTGSARDGLTGVLSQVSQLQQQAGAVLQGGEPGPMISALDQVKQLAGELIQQSDAARQAVAAAIARARQTGSAGN